MPEPTEKAAVSRQTMSLARSSYDRCCGSPDFFQAFYRNFFSACPEAEARFAHTDFARQHNLLRHAIGLLLIFPAQAKAEPTILTRVAERHRRGDLDVQPPLYGPFIESLLATVKQYDSKFTPEVEAAWRATVAEGVAYMQSKY